MARTKLCGLCGSDYKQVFMNGSLDNPMTGFISWPQVLGHEVVAVIDEVGPEVKKRRIGERVVLNPWLSCTPRGLPPCEWCQRGDLAQCLNFLQGPVAPGIHSGNSATATGGFAPRVPAHESQFIRARRIDVTPIITHRFSLEAYREAFMVCYAQGDHSAVKVLFDRFDSEE